MIHLIVWLVVRDASGRVLLGRRSGTTFADGLWNLPGGAVEPGEALLDAVTREAWEEVGLRVDPAALRSLGVSRYDVIGLGGPVAGVDFLFLAGAWDGEPQPLDKTSEVGWFAADALPPDCLPWLPGVLRAHLVEGVRLTEQLTGVEGIRSLPR
ncbi:NUDIX domain-containing protein [Deinococcus sp. SDU3-2]|uniref:NUDIX domain-containing protein n=1 Tax=Deinococcus terrestris TaxID=2651870 RepID=A0A7X1NXQ2_9DEIO|nr:NUDIX domain-containing protein [Deinococcus terrestris]MPY67274.1 NUDIX domain-containing protein [Deinococcus terrestris]